MNFFSILGFLKTPPVDLPSGNNYVTLHCKLIIFTLHLIYPVCPKFTDSLLFKISILLTANIQFMDKLNKLQIN